MFPDLGKAPLSADGRTLSGSKTETVGGGRTLSGSKTETVGGGASYTTQWNFLAERE